MDSSGRHTVLPSFTTTDMQWLWSTTWSPKNPHSQPGTWTSLTSSISTIGEAPSDTSSSTPKTEDWSSTSFPTTSNRVLFSSQSLETHGKPAFWKMGTLDWYPKLWHQDSTMKIWLWLRPIYWLRSFLSTRISSRRFRSKDIKTNDLLKKG